MRGGGGGIEGCEWQRGHKKKKKRRMETRATQPTGVVNQPHPRCQGTVSHSCSRVPESCGCTCSPHSPPPSSAPETITIAPATEEADIWTPHCS